MQVKGHELTYSTINFILLLLPQRVETLFCDQEEHPCTQPIVDPVVSKDEALFKKPRITVSWRGRERERGGGREREREREGERGRGRMRELLWVHVLCLNLILVVTLLSVVCNFHLTTQTIAMENSKSTRSPVARGRRARRGSTRGAKHSVGNRPKSASTNTGRACTTGTIREDLMWFDLDPVFGFGPED